MPLAEWISQAYKVNVLNIIYTILDHGERARLQICVEFESEVRKLKRGKFYNNDEEIENAIVQKFRELMLEQGITAPKDRRRTSVSAPEKTYMTKRVFTYYSAFAPVAQDETVERIPEEQIEELRKTIADKELWKIARFGTRITFFFYTDEQWKKYKTSDIPKEWSDMLFNLIKQYDEFDYFKRTKFRIYLDSRENFDTEYEGNWFYYYR